MSNRPLSPHVWVYKRRYTLVTSILNRITGCALTAGLLLLAYWLMSLASGAQDYASAVTTLSQPLFKVILAAVLFTFAYHLVAGIRHLVWDTGVGLERRQSQKSAWLVGVVALLLAVGLIAWACARSGAP